MGIYETAAGFVRPELTVAAHLTLAGQRGAELHFDEPALEWATTADGVQETTATGTYTAGRLVICPGAWAPELLGDLEVPFTVERQVMHWFQPSGGVEKFVRQVPLAGRAQAAGDGRRLGPAEVEAAGERHQVGARAGLELVPELVGAQQQRHVRRVLEVRLPDDARPAVARPAVVRRPEALEPEHPLPPRREMGRRGAAHAAEPDDDHVDGHPVPLPAASNDAGEAPRRGDCPR